MLPPELAADPRAPLLVDPSPSDGGEIPSGQIAFDLRTAVASPERVAAARGRVDGLAAAAAALTADLDAARARVAALAAESSRLTDEVRRNVNAAAAARAELADHAVSAFMGGRPSQRLALARADDPVELGVARRYLETVVVSDRAAWLAYETARARLDDRGAELAESLADSERVVIELAARAATVVAELAEARDELTQYEAGSHVAVRGFTFPVAGEVEFIDSWGFPRMTGTPVAHWHQGTDVFARLGTPLVAVERGRLARIGQASLGGNKLWVVGESGHHYYYAHLSAFAPGIAEGMAVEPGQVVGYVGDTGNARGTPPHLHFEVHPGGGDAVNPYPLLRAAHGARAMGRLVELPPAG